MVNKCAVFGCKRGYESEEPQHEDYHAFYFPLDERKSHLLPAWEKFVCRDGWKPSSNSVICEFHFEDRLIRKGKRWTLKWKLNPMPTMLTDEMKAMPQSIQPTPAAPPRKPPAKRTYQEDEINAFLSQDIIGDFSDLNSTHVPPGFQCSKSDNSIVFFNLTYVDFSALLALLSEHEIEIAESTLDSSSEEVSTIIAGYIAEKLAKRSNCDSCKSLLIASSMDLAENHYLNLLSRGGLIVPSAKLAEYTSHCFAIMDYSYNIVQAHGVRDVWAAYTQIFDRFSPRIDICCSKHNNWGLKFDAKIVIMTFFNNKQTVSSDSARKDTVVAFKKRQRTK